MTCDSGKYGWPASYMPLIDRAGVSMRPQYDAVRTISVALSGPPAPSPTTLPEVLALQSKVAALDAQIGVLNDAIGVQGQMIQSQQARLAAIGRAATQPTTQP